MSEQIKKKYKTVGIYKKPKVDPETGEVKSNRAYVSIYMGKDAPAVQMKNGDILSITKKEDKLAELQKVHAAGKLSDDTYQYLVGLYSADDVIGEVTLVQK